MGGHFKVVFVGLSCLLTGPVWVRGQDTTEQIVQSINDHLQQAWHDTGLTPSRPVPDGKWCRRVYLNILGRVPTMTELDAFLADRSADRRRRLVERLLTVSDYNDEYASFWSTIWTNVLIGRAGGSEEDSLTSRRGMQAYLRAAFAQNKAYDVLVSELVTATGTTRPGSSHFNGATNYLVMKLQDNAVQAAAKTSQLFLGTQVQCTQCHNHPFNDWKQDQFWQFNAFFRQAVALRRFESGSGMIREVELTDQDFAGEGPDPTEAETFFEQPNGVLQVAYPVFPDGTPLANRSGYLSDVNRRLELSKWILASPLLERALVNRMWKHFFGYGFTNPVDDLGPHQVVTHPQLLDDLARQFREHQFDLKQLIRWIALSEPHQLSSQIHRGNERDAVESGATPQFSRYYARQMLAEQLYGALLTATGAERTNRSRREQEAAKARWLRQFTIAYGNDEAEESTTFNGTIPQSLMMFNGELTEQAISLQGDNVLTTIVTGNSRPNQKIDQLFMATLARKPTGREKKLVIQLLSARMSAGTDVAEDPLPVAGDPRAQALQDLFWALLNSNEFILNH